MVILTQNSKLKLQNQGLKLLWFKVLFSVDKYLFYAAKFEIISLIVWLYFLAQVLWW